MPQQRCGRGSPHDDPKAQQLGPMARSPGDQYSRQALRRGHINQSAMNSPALAALCVFLCVAQPALKQSCPVHQRTIRKQRRRDSVRASRGTRPARRTFSEIQLAHSALPANKRMHHPGRRDSCTSGLPARTKMQEQASRGGSCSAAALTHRPARAPSTHAVRRSTGSAQPNYSKRGACRNSAADKPPPKEGTTKKAGNVRARKRRQHGDPPLA